MRCATIDPRRRGSFLRVSHGVSDRMLQNAERFPPRFRFLAGRTAPCSPVRTVQPLEYMTADLSTAAPPDRAGTSRGDDGPQRKAAVADGEHAHPPTPAETWAEESPAYHAPVEFSGTAEDDFWKANHHSQSYAGETSHGSFAPAYRVGYEGYARHGVEGRTFAEAEPLLRKQYEKAGGTLEWTAARMGAEAAWNRLSQRRIGSAKPSPAPQKP